MKVDFSKIEQAIIACLRKITVDNLLELADIAASTGMEASRKRALLHQYTQINMLRVQLKFEIRWLYKQNKKLYTMMGLDKKIVKELLSTYDLTEEEVQLLYKIRDKIREYKTQLRGKLPDDYDEQLVETERVKHKNKRFNIKDTWLPLH